MTIKLKSDVLYTGDIKLSQMDLELIKSALEFYMIKAVVSPRPYEDTFKTVSAMITEIEFDGICEFAQENAA